MSSTLEELIAKLNAYTPYQAMTQQEMEAAAQRRYQAVYDQKRLSAQQAWESSDQALSRELSALQLSYDRQRASAKAHNEQTYREADRRALSRGMQRSSYNSANLSGIRLAGGEALAAIDREQTQDEDELAQKRTLLSTQLAQELSGYDVQQRSEEMSYLDELQAREYERTVQSQQTASELAMKIYEYQHQLEVEAAEQARWQAEFNAKYGTARRSGGGGGSKTTTKVVIVPQVVKPSQQKKTAASTAPKGGGDATVKKMTK